MPVSEERLEEIKAIDDSEIDTSDIPELDDDFWNGLRRKGRLSISHERCSERLCLQSPITPDLRSHHDRKRISSIVCKRYSTAPFHLLLVRELPARPQAVGLTRWDLFSSISCWCWLNFSNISCCWRSRRPSQSRISLLRSVRSRFSRYASTCGKAMAAKSSPIKMLLRY